MERWKFGVGQSAREERQEMRQAHEAGRSAEYARGQRYARLIAAERERKAQAKAARRARR
jgi:hypothetical protein